MVPNVHHSFLYQMNNKIENIIFVQTHFMRSLNSVKTINHPNAFSSLSLSKNRNTMCQWLAASMRLVRRRLMSKYSENILKFTNCQEDDININNYLSTKEVFTSKC